MRGLSIMGFLVVLGVVGFFVFLGMRIGPSFMEYRAVVTAMKAAANDPELKGRSPGELRKGIQRRFMVSYVDSIRADAVKIVNNGSEQFMEVEYEVRKDLMYNIDFVATFHHKEPLAR